MRIVLLVTLTAACRNFSPPADTDRDSGGTGDCGDGTQFCVGNSLHGCENGAVVLVEDCTAVCVDSLGCVGCVPGSEHCGTFCRADGSGFDGAGCDPILGIECDVDTGRCEGACSSDSLGNSYIGCEYFPTVTANAVNGDFEFAIAVSNASTETADVIVDGNFTMTSFSVEPGDVHVEKLPWNFKLKACYAMGFFCAEPDATSVLARKGGYRVRSTQPVTVYQFSPLDYVDPGTGLYSISNDASLLFPKNAMSDEYVVAAWPSWTSSFGTYPGVFAVTATEDDTEVAIQTTAPVRAGDLPAFDPGETEVVNLSRGDVLELFSYAGDLSGSTVTANKPIQVIGGHFCTYIPEGDPACDHLEDNMIPRDALGRKYIVTPPAIATGTEAKKRIIRIIAVEPDTTLTYDPPQPSAPPHIGSAGGIAQIQNNDEPFLIEADKRILVAQYMLGQSTGQNIGDPAFTSAVPVEQYRDHYLFHASPNYDVNHVNVVAPLGAILDLDGQTIEDLTPIGGTGYGVKRIVLPDGDGTHSITGDERFGITVYGYGQFTSYWYPGGLDLEPIVVP